MPRARVVFACVASVVCVAVATAPGASAPGASAQTGPDPASPAVVEQLFVQTAAGGSLAPIKGEDGVFVLTLRGASAEVTSFTDRPVRVAADLPTSEFVGLWDGGPFADDPPNAALVIDGAPDGKDVFVFELAKPRYDEGRGTLRYRATEIVEEPNGRLASFADSVDGAAPARFGRASLFVDAVGGTPMTVEFSGVPSNSNLDVGFGGGYETSYAESVQAGAVRFFTTAARVVGIASGTSSVPTAGTVRATYCVGPETPEVGLFVSGSGSVSITFEGEAPQTFGPGGDGTLIIPAAAQQEGCPS